MQLSEKNGISKVYDSPENLRTIKKTLEQILMAVEFEIRRILAQMGAKVTPESTEEEVEVQKKLLGIECFHVNYKNSPHMNGWHFYQYGEPLLILCDPKPDPKDRSKIILERKMPVDVL